MGVVGLRAKALPHWCWRIWSASQPDFSAPLSRSEAALDAVAYEKQSPGYCLADPNHPRTAAVSESFSHLFQGVLTFLVAQISVDASTPNKAPSWGDNDFNYEFHTLLIQTFARG